LADLDERLARGAEALARQGVAAIPPEVTFTREGSDFSPYRGKLSGVKIAIAKDNAFSFIYQANIDLLTYLGAELIYFSPIVDTVFPEADALYLPGGYPELYLTELSQNIPIREAIRAHHEEGLPILAECGGMLYLLEELEMKGFSAPMVGIIPGKAALTKGLRGLGLMYANLPEGTLRGHSFHHSSLNLGIAPLTEAIRHDGRQGEMEKVFRLKRTTASYIHFYFASNIPATIGLFQKLI
jgi:cobyrinic acid a,c-diamide synthase